MEHHLFDQNNVQYNHDKLTFDRQQNLTSNEVSDEQTIDLAWLFAVLRRRVWIMGTTAFLLSLMTGSYIVWNSKQEVPSYEGSVRILIEPVTAEGRLARLSLLAESGGNTDLTDITAKLGIDSSDLVDYESMIRVLTSPTIMEPLVETLKNEYPEISYNTLQSKLILNRISYEQDGKQEGTKILLVRYQDKDTNKILFILEEVAQTYLQYSLEERLKTLNKGIDFIDEQLPVLQERVDFFQEQLQDLRKRYEINIPMIDAQMLSDQSLSIKKIKTQIREELASKQIFYDRFKIEIESGNPMLLLTLKGKSYETILSEIQQIDIELAIKLNQFKEDSIPVQILQDRRQKMIALVQDIAKSELESIAIEIGQLESRLEAIEREENILNQKSRILPDVLRQYADIERDLQVANESLKTFLEKREALSLNASQKDFPWYIISPPKLTINPNGNLIPTSQSSTRKQLALALILSTLLGIGTGLICEILDPVFHTPEDIRAGIKISIIGVIPLDKGIKKKNKKNTKIHQIFAKNSFKPNENGIQRSYSNVFVESFRSLYTNINLLGAKNNPVRSLVISSASREDGKSTIALQLAQTAASIGKRVLLVDADLRHPQLHEYLGLHNQQGLSDSVINYLSLNEVIQQSALEENLFFLSAGQFTPDPIKLLSSQKMQYLMGQFQGFFDLVIYDTPPLVGLADAHLVAARVDGVILVVRLAQTDQSLVKKALEELKISHATLLGVVANEVKNSDYVAMSANQQYHNSFIRE